MDVKEAVGLAKQHILELYTEEQITNLGLEEVDFDDPAGDWYVTLGFSRPCDEPRNTLVILGREALYPKRTYKVLRISDRTSKVLSVKNREVAA